MEITKTEIGKRIKKAILRAGLSQKDLAGTLGVVEPTVTGYINGRNEPSLTTIIKIAESTSVSIDWLITGNDGMDVISGEESPTYAASHDVICKLSDQDKYLIAEMKSNPEAAAMMKMFLEMPPEERTDAQEVVKMYRELPRSQRMRRKADILEDIEKIEEKKKGASNETP